MIDRTAGRREDPAERIGFLLRRAEQESIAAIRSVNPTAAERHDIMAHAYSVMAVSMLGSHSGNRPEIGTD